MFVLGSFFSALAWLVNMLFEALLLILFVNALLSWARPDPANPLVRFLHAVSDFLCNPIRRLFPTVVSGLDLAPLIAMVAIEFLRRFIVPALYGLSASMH